MKQCFKCKEIKDLTEFYKHPAMADGYVNKCKECNKLDIQKNYIDNRGEKLAYDHYRHRYSIPRIFNHRYAGIKTRCTKVRSSNGKPYRVHGTKYLNKQQWLEWCYSKNNYKKFISIYNNWVQSGFNNKLTPSIDRINNNLGYQSNNLQWLTTQENCIKHTK